MKDRDCVDFLRWCLPELRLRWPGFRKVRGQVCKRIGRRLDDLRLPGPGAYKEYIVSHPGEWSLLDSMCRVTVSRFYRDRKVFEILTSLVLPRLAERASSQGEREVRCWSAGCASGEEAYTLSLIWKLRIASAGTALPRLLILGTDMDARLLGRARNGLFPASSLRDLPPDLVSRAFDAAGGEYSLKERFREGVRFAGQDIRKRMPEGPFHIILCRNLVWTYYDDSLQAELLEKIAHRLKRGGTLVTGIHEKPPAATAGSMLVRTHPCVYEKVR